MGIVASWSPGEEQLDDDLLLLAAKGDKQAFSRFYDHTSTRIYGLVKRVLVDAAQSEEVTQDVYLGAWQNASRFDPARGRAISWLLTVAHRRAIDRVRSSQASRDRDFAVGIRDFEESRDDVEETVVITLEHQRVTAAIRHLTPFQQEALELTYFQGLTSAEAAVTLGVPASTLKTRVRDALIALRTRVEDPHAA